MNEQKIASKTGMTFFTAKHEANSMTLSQTASRFGGLDAGDWTILLTFLISIGIWLM
jgi:hypothetical protein